MVAGGVVDVAAAHNTSEAEAVTKTQCYYGYRNNGSYPGVRVRYCYYDYNWWEESWMGGSNRDGWYYEHVPVYT